MHGEKMIGSIEYPNGPGHNQETASNRPIGETIRHTTPNPEKGTKNVDDEIFNAGTRAAALTILNSADVQGVPRLKTIQVMDVPTEGDLKRIIYTRRHKERSVDIEKIEGHNLAKIGKLQIGPAKEIISGVARICRDCARAGILHNDLHPQNIIYNHRERQPYLVDFDSAHFMDEYATPTKPGYARIRGAMEGAPSYMAPEKHLYEETGETLMIDERSEIYSIACLGLASLVGFEDYERVLENGPRKRLEHTKELPPAKKNVTMELPKRISQNTHIEEETIGAKKKRVLIELLEEEHLTEDPYVIYLLEQLEDLPQKRSAQTLEDFYNKLNAIQRNE